LNRAGWLLTLLAPLLAGPADSATRVISLAPHTTEMVIAAGGEERLLAAVPADQPLPPQTLAMSVVGGIDREQTVALNPDLVVAWRSGNRPADIAWLRDQGIPIFLSEPRELEGIAADIRAIGRRLGTEQRAEMAARHFLARLQTPCATLPEKEVYIEIWDRPAMSIGGAHWLNDALSRVRLRNTFEVLALPVFAVDRESLLSKADLPRVRLRADSPLGSKQLGRPGPSLAAGIERLCAQRMQLMRKPGDGDSR